MTTIDKAVCHLGSIQEGITFGTRNRDLFPALSDHYSSMIEPSCGCGVSSRQVDEFKAVSALVEAFYSSQKLRLSAFYWGTWCCDFLVGF